MQLIFKAWDHIVRNWMTSLPAVLIISLVLFLCNGLIGVQQKTDRALANLQQKFSITFFLRNDADSFALTKLISELEARADVVPPVTYTSQEDARAFIEKAFSLGANGVSAGDIALPASLTVTPKSPDDVARIESFVRNTGGKLLNEINKSRTTQQSITTQMGTFLKDIEDTTQRALLFFIALFIGAGFLFITNAISLTMANHRKEISIMKLVGAHFGTITTPYIIEGILLGLLAFAINFIATLALNAFWIEPRIALNALLLELIAVTGLGAISSYVTAHVYLRK